MLLRYKYANKVVTLPDTGALSSCSNNLGQHELMTQIHSLNSHVIVAIVTSCTLSGKQGMHEIKASSHEWDAHVLTSS